ncbi:MAG: hypothetical protein JNL97_05830, partial [Verrucomicrobiales bacterium]|nr:hypothetical protein [Verrucomicrobiales bacterium]
MNSFHPLLSSARGSGAVALGFFRGMRAFVFACFVLGLAFRAGMPDAQAARAPEPLAVRAAEHRIELSLPREPIPPVGGSSYRLRVESTADLQSWSAAGELGPGDAGLPALTIRPESPHRFFRLASEIELGSTEVGGADLWGYNRVFAEELRDVGYLTPAEFAAGHRPGTEMLD